MKRTTRQALVKYGATNCLRAFIWNASHGEGASSIALTMPNDHERRIHTTQQADAAINAGRDLSGDSIDVAYALMKDAYTYDSSPDRAERLREVEAAIEIEAIRKRMAKSE